MAFSARHNVRNGAEYRVKYTWNFIEKIHFASQVYAKRSATNTLLNAVYRALEHSFFVFRRVTC